MPTSSDIFLFGKFRFDRAGGGLFERDDRAALRRSRSGRAHSIFSPC